MSHYTSDWSQTARVEKLCPEVSVVIPCLNEADTIGKCIQSAHLALQENNIIGEVIVADNGSTDGCQAIATQLGARLVTVQSSGYGNALMGGIAAARGRFIVMGDADDSYDFKEIPKFVEKLRGGSELVVGCRLPRGGGRIMRGAMPFLHRWWGNPMFSLMARWWFHVPIHDVYCGMRGFSKQTYEGWDQRCTGMEFATEMILKSGLYNVKMAEVPITLYPDGRKSHRSHLRTFRDGWRTLRFFLMYSPRWLFLIPGVVGILLGAFGYALALPGFTLNGIRFDAHTLLFASLAMICGYQSILFTIFTKTFAINEGLLPGDRVMSRFIQTINLERGLIVALGSLFMGLALLVAAVNQWRISDFGDLDYSQTMRLVVPGAMLTSLGYQTILSSFFLSILGMSRKRTPVSITNRQKST